jgi:hypothetical protein
MSPPTIVPTLDIFEGGQPGSGPRRKVNMIHQFTFECLEKALGHRIVPAIAFSAHALLNWQAVELLSEFGAGILNTPVRTKQK